jgi:hypothetical protein
VRKCLETTCTGPLTHRAWLQAGLATASGGLGLRHAALHGAAAYAAFVAATADLCLALDANYIPPLDEAFRAVNEVVCAADSFPVPPPPNHLQQQQLSQAVDRAVATQSDQSARFSRSWFACGCGWLCLTQRHRMPLV